MSEGDTREETLQNIQEAMELWMEVNSDGNAQKPLPETPALIAAEVQFVLGWRAEVSWPLVVETATVTLPVTVAA